MPRGGGAAAAAPAQRECRGAQAGGVGFRTILDKSPRYSHGSLGQAEQSNKAGEQQVRCILSTLLQQAGFSPEPTEAIMAWVIRHGGWAVHRFRVLPTGRTAYREIKGREYSGEIVEFGEAVYARDPGPATAAA